MKENIMAQLIAIIGMVIALLASFGLGRWLDIAQKQAAASFEFAPFFWGALLTNLLDEKSLNRNLPESNECPRKPQPGM